MSSPTTVNADTLSLRVALAADFNTNTVCPILLASYVAVTVNVPDPGVVTV